MPTNLVAAAWEGMVGVAHPTSTGGEKPGVGAAGADFQPNWFRAFWAVALIGGSIAVYVHANVNVAALELNSHEAAASGRRLSFTPALPR
jgi:hypothetical protein